MKHPEYKLEINGRYMAYSPKEDITAFEAAQLFRLLIVAAHAPVTAEQRVEFLDTYNLWRHFDEVTNG